jgi:alkanesulfonate monooxygenase SsuD/methylene tetrahydromethanopterin reductase-like flavin-dependent oxidoreductase (luciferase family)
VGGTPSSVERAGRLGLPMALGLIGGDTRRARPLIEHYRAVGTAAGHPADRLRLGRSGHFYVGRTSQGARDDVFPFYKEYVRPKPPTGRGFHIGRAEFDAAAVPFGALMVGSPQEIIDKILAERDVLGIDRYLGQIDFGGMPAGMVHDSIELLATEIAPVIRRELAPPAGPAAA